MNENNAENIAVVRKMLTREDLLCQLAEEASELSQAAMKLRRTETGRNPTNLSREKALRNLVEECADIQAVVMVMMLDKKRDQVVEDMRSISEFKLARWAWRLEGGVPDVESS